MIGDEPVFPIPKMTSSAGESFIGDLFRNINPGLTKRELAAMICLLGHLNRHGLNDPGNPASLSADDKAEKAIEQADALLKALSKTPEEK